MFTKADIEKYFTAEKQESLVFLIVGGAAVVAALVFFIVYKTSFLKGMAIPFAVFGLLFAIVGYTVYKRSDDDRKRNVYAYDMNPTELKEKEIPRMQKVMKDFVTYRWTEIVVLLAGCVLFYLYRSNDTRQLLAGIGIGCILMAAFGLVADAFAEKRGHVYLQGLKSFVQQLK